MNNPSDQEVAIEYLREATIEFLTEVPPPPDLTKIHIIYGRYRTMVSMTLQYYYAPCFMCQVDIDVGIPLSASWPKYYINGGLYHSIDDVICNLPAPLGGAR